MPYTVDYSFSSFDDAIRLSGDHQNAANKRRDWLVSKLEANLTVTDSFSIGSIPRRTALSTHADLDILVVLHYGKHIKGKSPVAVLNAVKTALGASAGSIRRNGQAVTVKFTSWPSVDVVPASKVVNSDKSISHYEIPDSVNDSWLHTQPRRHSKTIQSLSSCGTSKVRPVIRMLKHWNRVKSIGLESYHIEAIAALTSTDWTDYDWSIFQWFEEALQRLDFCWYNSGDASAYLEWSRRPAVKARIQNARTLANQAWYEKYSNDDDEAAIRLWRELFGWSYPAYGS